MRLRQCTPKSVGIQRIRRGRDFSYRTSGDITLDVSTRAQINYLAIPPAWHSTQGAHGTSSDLLRKRGHDLRGKTTRSARCSI